MNMYKSIQLMFASLNSLVMLAFAQLVHHEEDVTQGQFSQFFLGGTRHSGGPRNYGRWSPF